MNSGPIKTNPWFTSDSWQSTDENSVGEAQGSCDHGSTYGPRYDQYFQFPDYLQQPTQPESSPQLGSGALS